MGDEVRLTEGRFRGNSLAELYIVALSDRIFGGHSEQIVAAFPQLGGGRAGGLGACARHADPVVARRVTPFHDVSLDRRSTVTRRLVPRQRH